MQKLISIILKNYVFIALVITITNCVAQEKIILTTGDTVVGSLSKVKVDYDHSLLHKTNNTTSVGLFAEASPTFNKTIAYPIIDSKKGKEKIIVGWIINTVGAFFVYQSFAIRRREIYNYYGGGQTDMRQKSIAAASLGSLCLVIGTANLVKGYKLKKETSVSAIVSPNNIALVYRW